jgi:alpha-tubulin suppressor-like RCC1 family protein
VNHKIAKKLKIKKYSGFALPTVLISSLIMLAVLMMSVVSTSAVRSALDVQYYDQLSKNASEAGLAYAQACLSINDGKPLWSTANPLKPNTDCSGIKIPGNDNDYILLDKNIKTSFVVNLPSTDAVGRATNLLVDSSTSLLRSSDSDSAWRVYGQTSRLNQSVQTRKKIVSGDSHTCAILFDNKIVCWGRDNYGQLGDGDSSTASRHLPSLIAPGAMGNTYQATDLTAGAFHTCAIFNAETYCWGYNQYATLGIGSSDINPHSLPIKISSTLNNLKTVVAGNTGSCALTNLIGSDIYTYCWGRNDSGQVGNASTLSVGESPYNGVSPPAGVRRTVTAGDYIKNFTSLMLGHSHTCAINSSSKVYCWGSDLYGQLGNNSTSSTSNSIPLIVQYSSGSDFVAQSLGKVSGSVQHSCAIVSVPPINKAYCWGFNSSGQLGTSNNSNALNPTAVTATSGNVLYNKNVQKLAMGSFNTCVVADSKVYCWGSNTYGQLGDGTTVPKNYPVAVVTAGTPMDNRTITDVSVGNGFVCAVDLEGNAYCWGHNNYGQLGKTPSETIEPKPIATFSQTSVDYKF